MLRASLLCWKELNSDGQAMQHELRPQPQKALLQRTGRRVQKEAALKPEVHGYLEGLSEILQYPHGDVGTSSLEQSHLEAPSLEGASEYEAANKGEKEQIKSKDILFCFIPVAIFPSGANIVRNALVSNTHHTWATLGRVLNLLVNRSWRTNSDFAKCNESSAQMPSLLTSCQLY